MHHSQQLTLLWTPWTLVVSVVVLCLTGVLCWISWRRQGYAPWFGGLELLRFVIIGLCLALLNQPEWVQQFRPDHKPTIVVVHDDTVSMSTRDVESSGPGSPLISRRESIAQLVDQATWSSLQAEWDVVVQPMSRLSSDQDLTADNAKTNSAASESNLYAALIEPKTRFTNLRSIVLISDADWNAGPPPVEAATQLRLQEIPVFSIPVGRPSRLPDLELATLEVPTFGVAGKSVRVGFTIESSLPRDTTTTVTLRVTDQETMTKDVRLLAMGRTNDAFMWKPQTTGDYMLTVEVTRHPDETFPDNNVLASPIAIRNESLKVLVIESYPRWEYRYLRNALSRDPGVEVDCLLFHPGLGKVGGGNQDYISEFPDGLERLSKYDVVFLGDVGLDDGQLSVEQCRLIKGLVEFQASGLVLMPGWQGRQHSLRDTELNELYPVILDDDQPDGWGSRTPGHFELTELGRRSLLTKLADTTEENIDVWENLPGFQWHAPVVRAKAGTDILAVHQDMMNSHGRVPLLVTRTFGAGKVLFMGTDGAWRWREGVEDKYHYRFWGQVVRWMAYQRNMAKGESMRLYYTPDQPQLDQTMTFHANVMESSGEPLTKGDVLARITTPSGKNETLRFAVSTEEDWGDFRAQYTAHEPGQHQVKLSCRQTNGVLDATFFVQGEVSERIGRPARPEVLEEISRVTQGKVLDPRDLTRVIQSIASLPDPPLAVRRTAIWSHPSSVGILIAMLGIFWIGRKAGGWI